MNTERRYGYFDGFGVFVTLTDEQAEAFARGDAAWANRTLYKVDVVLAVELEALRCAAEIRAEKGGGS